MHFFLMVATLGVSLSDGGLTPQNDGLSSFNSLIQKMGSRIMLKEFENYKCIIALSDVPEGLAHLNFWFPAAVLISLASGEVPVERLLVSALDADCRGLVVRCRDAAACVDALLKASKLAITRVNRRLLVLPAAQFPQINVSAIFALRNIDLVPDILVARMADDTASFELVTLMLTGEETWRNELVVARWSRPRGLHPPSADLYPDRLADLAGRSFIIATFDYPPYVVLNSDANLFDGVDTRIILELVRKKNATWGLLEDTTCKWGTIWENGSGNGVLGAVAMDEADLADDGLYTWYPEYLFVEYSRPYMRAGIACLAPRPLLLPGWQVPILPFSPPLWAVVGCSVIFATAALYAAKKLSDQVLGKDDGPAGGRYSTVEDCFFRSLGLLVLQTPDMERRHTRVVGPTRHVLSWLLLAYLLVTVSYSSGLSSMLTIPRYEPPIDTVADLHGSGLKWAGMDIAYLKSLRGRTDQIALDLIDRFRVLTPDILRSRITTRDLAFAVERLPGEYFAIGDYMDEEALSKWLRPMREDIYWENVVFAVRKGWPYLEQLNDIIDRLFEAGIISTWEGQVARKWLVPRVQLAAQVGMRSYAQAPDGPVKLQLTHVQGEFALLVLGLCVSLVVFVLETAVHWKTNDTTQLEFRSSITVTLEVCRSAARLEKGVQSTASRAHGRRRNSGGVTDFIY
ncbi:glutamate receptor ionotropic, kainate 2-like [Schistocerca americana]|uniref:glutamate receptor ionotropic, kainate 2-like n=1 Tax=Schistocerca americana TaxID=7009 RepID=UPI001F4F422C|nr:glutamate receptor ionotropic, kainate 2-like [Schistocerca americana]